ncbi:uncharacterized protein LOC123540277 [Mercenaria mercenaria]|uniref:uncharacterized protein LOC123540277 n=1 Tax=Mercenaria mercenaria TaxID=6596 RepID=UPI00234FA99D|nr:uncharacterized protein LOC123540277 [Mercenaria mercenaria]XP_053382867.1 uncharacterized protein LOC123540277 [Mercenaria mercenaria]
MYSNSNREIYTLRDGNVREAKGYEIEEILRRRYQSEQDKLRNGFKNELGNLQAEKKRIEDSLQKYTEKFLNIKMKEFESTIDHRMGLSGGFKNDDTDREQTNSLGHSAAGESQRDDMKKYFERELKLFEEIVEQQKKELEDKQDALNRVMFELDNAKASDDYMDNEEDDDDNDKGGDANGQENASEDSVQNSSGKKKGKGKPSKACIVS